MEPFFLAVIVAASLGTLGLAVTLLLDTHAGNDRRKTRHADLLLTEPLLPDPERSDDGEWLHELLIEAYGDVEFEAWALSRVERVTERLQAERPPEQRLITEILWIPDVNAFTAPGRYIYISRRLLERCASDEPVAFIIAHEIAHHDLGHVNLFRGWLAHLPRGAGSKLIAAGIRLLERRLYGPEEEAAADAHGLDLCAAAGYDLERCLRFFDIAEAHALDYRDFDAVFGPEFEAMEEDSASGEWIRNVKTWVRQRERGYPSIRDRKAALFDRAGEGGQSAPSPTRSSRR